MDYKKILSLPTLDLINWLDRSFRITLPTEILSVEDMQEASNLLIQLSGYYSYLCSLSSYAKAVTRIIKREGNKKEYEDMVDKKEAIQNVTEAVKQQYSAVSRAVTIHIENNQELKMNTTGIIKY